MPGINGFLAQALTPLGVPMSEEPMLQECSGSYITWAKTGEKSIYASGKRLFRQDQVQVSLWVHPDQDTGGPAKGSGAAAHGCGMPHPVPGEQMAAGHRPSAGGACLRIAHGGMYMKARISVTGDLKEFAVALEGARKAVDRESLLQALEAGGAMVQESVQRQVSGKAKSHPRGQLSESITVQRSPNKRRGGDRGLGNHAHAGQTQQAAARAQPRQWFHGCKRQIPQGYHRGGLWPHPGIQRKPEAAAHGTRNGRSPRPGREESSGHH